MSRLDELIQQFCPRGVEYKKLGDIATNIFRGAGITRDQVTETGIPCVRYGEIYTDYGVWFDKCISHTSLDLLTSPKFFEHGDILFAITGEKVEDIAKSTAYIGHEKCVAGGDIVVLKHKQNPKYLGYALSTKEAQAQKSKGRVKSKVVHSSVPAIESITIPLPPLPIQEEIVRILDTFIQLEAELEAELEARRKQYEYYRNKLLSFNELTKSNPGGVKQKALASFCEIGTGRSNRDDAILNGLYPFYVRSKDVFRNNEYEFDDKEAIIIPGEGGIGEIFHYAQGKYALHQRAYRVCPKMEGLNGKYLYYYMIVHFHNFIQKKAVSATVTSIRKPMLECFEIVIPPLSEQERIVGILDRFESLVNDLSSGLPAELAARRQQYEHYRDRLLTFAPAE